MKEFKNHTLKQPSDSVDYGRKSFDRKSQFFEKTNDIKYE